MKVQPFSISDRSEVALLFRETVTYINSKDYSPDQIETWVKAVDDEEAFGKRLLSSIALVGRIGDKIVGFTNLLEDGHLDCLYVHKDFQRKGVASALLQAIETRARESSCNVMRTDASKTALPFFEQNGFVLVREQSVVFNGVTFENYVMEKNL